MAPIQVFVEIRRPHRSYGYYCAICPFSSGGNIIQKKKKKKKKKKNPTQIMTCAPAYGLGTSKKKLDPVPGWTCAQEAFPVVLSLMAYRI